MEAIYEVQGADLLEPDWLKGREKMEIVQVSGDDQV